MIRNETPVIMITTYSDFGVYAYDVRNENGPHARMILGHDVQDGEHTVESVDDVLQAVRTRLLEALGVEDDA
jgi:hypothetical protein